MSETRDAIRIASGILVDGRETIDGPTARKIARALVKLHSDAIEAKQEMHGRARSANDTGNSRSASGLDVAAEGYYGEAKGFDEAARILGNALDR